MSFTIDDLGDRLAEAAQDAQVYMQKAELEFAELHDVLREIHILTGQPYQTACLEMTVVKYAAVVRDFVAELRQGYDELAIERDVAGRGMSSA